MKLNSLFIFFSLVFSLQTFSQRGVRIGYIDMDEILQNVSEYKTADELLNKDVENWKKEVQLKKMQLKNLEEQFQAEKILLTQELIEDRKSELDLFRSEIIGLQAKYFGPQGNYIQQKNRLLKPIQDQVLSIVRQIAEERKYDFIFDRSSDLVMLYSAKNYDISDLVLQRINAQERIKARKKEIEERKAKIEERKKN